MCTDARITNQIREAAIETVETLDEIGSMMVLNESPRETKRPTRSLATPNLRTQHGTWSVRTMCAKGMVAQVTMEMDHYEIEVLLISECR